MIILDLDPGSDEWKEARRKHHTASEAPAMANVSKHLSRADLIRQKATGVEVEHDSYVADVVFKEGHRVEALARPFAEEIIGETLFPVVGTDDNGYLLASFDGLTMGQDISWENKQWNEAKAADVLAGIVPAEDLPQVIQQLVVSGADKCLYMVSDGTKEKTVSCWYSLLPEDTKDLLGGWKQIDDDVADYRHVDAVVEVIGRAPETLPALRVGVTGMVTESNFIEFKDAAISGINSINTELVTDSDFANAKETVKWLQGVETNLVDAKKKALSETQSIDDLFRAIDDIKEVARKTRLNLNKTVTVREKARKEEIVMSGKSSLAEYIDSKNVMLGKPYMPVIDEDFAGAVIRGLKLMSKRQDAVDAELARAKIEANKAAEKIKANLDSLRDLASGHKFLFPDILSVINKDNDDLVSLIKARIADHEAEETKRREDEREKIRLEEQEKLSFQEAQKQNPASHDPVLLTGGQPLISKELLGSMPYQKLRNEKAVKTITDSLIENGIGKQVAKKVAILISEDKIEGAGVINF